MYQLFLKNRGKMIKLEKILDNNINTMSDSEVWMTDNRSEWNLNYCRKFWIQTSKSRKVTESCEKC